MPSAARQRLPAEMWKSPHHSMKSPVPSYSSRVIEANPGYSEPLSYEAGLKSGKPASQKDFKRQLTNSNKKYKKRNSLQRRGSSDDILRNQDVSSPTAQIGSVSASVCSDSECGVSYNSTDVADHFAVDSIKAPAVNALPLPPIEWLKLKPFPKKNLKPALQGTSIQALLGTLAAAERCVVKTM